MTELCEGRVFLLKGDQGKFEATDAKNSSHIEWCAVPRISDFVFHVLHDGGSTNIAGNRKWTMNEGCISNAKHGDFLAIAR